MIPSPTLVLYRDPQSWDPYTEHTGIPTLHWGLPVCLGLVPVKRGLSLTVPPSPQCVPAAPPAGPGKVSEQRSPCADAASGGGSNQELAPDLGLPFSCMVWGRG